MNPYSYPDGESHFELQLDKMTPRWSRYAVDFATAHPTDYEETNTVRAEYFQPRESDHAPLAILLHGIGDHSTLPCKLLARTLASRGIACLCSSQLSGFAWRLSWVAAMPCSPPIHMLSFFRSILRSKSFTSRLRSTIPLRITLRDR